MDRLTRNRKAARELVETFAAQWGPTDGTETFAVVDEEHGHYQVLNMGWLGARFVHLCLMHIIVKPDGEVHLARNNTDAEIDKDLIEMGVAASDIVIAFRRRAPADHAT